jgi:putative endonuclease
MDTDVRLAAAINSGSEAEKAAEKMLQEAGLQILARNFQCKMGEIDLIAKENVNTGITKEKTTIVFVEVRRRSHGGFGSGFDSVDYRKQQKLIRTAHLYLQHYKFFNQYPCRFDIVSVRSLSDIQWIKNAFQPH